jgi:hypothetical protein
MLKAQPDFLVRKSKIEECLNSLGAFADFYPKFHPNSIGLSSAKQLPTRNVIIPSKYWKKLFQKLFGMFL